MNKNYRWVGRDDGTLTLVADDLSKCGWVAKHPDPDVSLGVSWKWEAFIGCDVNGFGDSADGSSESLEDAQGQVLKFCGLPK